MVESRPQAGRWPDGLCSKRMKIAMDAAPSVLSGRTSSSIGLGDFSVQSSRLDGMDMLNEMFQRQARRLEAQLLQRAQDQHALQVAQQKTQQQEQVTQIAQEQVKNHEQYDELQAAQISQSAESLWQMQQKATQLLNEVGQVVSAYEALRHDIYQLRNSLGRENPQALQQLELKSDGRDTSCIGALSASVSELQAIASELQVIMRAMERVAGERMAGECVAATPSTLAVMSSGSGSTAWLARVDGLALLAAACRPSVATPNVTTP